MSKEVHVDCEIRSMTIMENTLNQMRISYNVKNADTFTITRPYHNIVINGKKGKVSYDDMDKKYVEKILQNYTVNWYKDRAIREGNEIREEVQANGEIHIHVIR